MATKYKPFLFERSFDEVDAARARRAQAANMDEDATDADEPETDETPAEPEEPPAPTFSEEELESAKRAAFEEGRNEGLAAGRKEVQDDVDAQAVEALEALAEGLAPLFEQQRDAHERASALTVKIVRDIFERLMPAYVARHGDEEVVALVRDSVANLQDVGKLTVRVDETVRDTLAERLETLVRQAGFEGKLAVLGDPALGRADVAVDWGTGGAERRYSEIWADVETAVARAIDGLEPHDGDAGTDPGDANGDAAEDEDDNTDTAPAAPTAESAAKTDAGPAETDETSRPAGGDAPADDER